MSENLLILISPSVLSQPRPQRYYVNGLNGGSIIIIILIRRQSGSAEAWKPRDGERSSSFFNVFYDLGQIVWSMCTLHVSVTESGNSRQGREGRTIAVMDCHVPTPVQDDLVQSSHKAGDKNYPHFTDEETEAQR